mmetsp:Transcript_21597/g.59892  ORF Transcript_21597/g.59892 Transcript_21597/m.59892 type:complete len:242 (+) Transcript_21597:118-843(+)|eukprot:CAMPEP_0202339866 /NCGR_PEP_ID=MMETSP1126-20121109/1547_1 /ASSEMBLY_ACC=CAM_ASM_000457 /TAXON_ID=3047 /ORGANISM="Dunaliella tertiolecta, Strain CCMP1320" /LENGTH=241 /DNA_ID=CAMNT_0048930483 /DNA_START=57 /DNA_END=782 /DNA_ORIENTATION=+
MSENSNKEEWIKGATDVFFNPLGDTEYGFDEELGFTPKPQFQGLGGKGLAGFDGGDGNPPIDNFLFNSNFTPKERIRFFLEIDFSDNEVLERLPEPFAKNPPAQSRILQIVRWYVSNRFKAPDLKFFVEEVIPEDFELNGRVFVLSYYILPPRRPAPVKIIPSADKNENFAANLEAEPYATRLAVGNIIVLFVGFALSLVGVSCERDDCQRANSFGQLITALAALSLACVATYMSFLVATY